MAKESKRIQVLIPAKFQEVDAGRVHEWLADRDIDVEGVAVSEKKGMLFITLNDPNQENAMREVLKSYNGEKTRKEQFRDNAIEDMMPIIKAIAQKPRNERTAPEKALLGLAVIARDIVE